MRAITNTNIIVDDFDFCKEYPKNTFVHFITHFHADHYIGLSPLWDFSEKIYCSSLTRNLILHKFPKLEHRVTALELNVKHQIALTKHRSVSVHFFDAYHIPGSVMILFQGYMGTIFHTGDFRFHPDMIHKNPILFPPQAVNKSLTACAIQVDEMVFDNTYCNKVFDFPRAEAVLEQMIAIIKKNSKKRVLIAMGALGKEQICIRLSEYFQTLLIISQQRLSQLKSIGTYRTDIFTTDREKGFIEIVKKRDKDRMTREFTKLKYDFIVITTDFLMLEHKDPDGINYMVPYSLHSNFSEMESLVRAVSPSILRRLVLEMFKITRLRRKQTLSFLQFYESYVKGLRKQLTSLGPNDSNGGYAFLKHSYTRIGKLSTDFRRWMHPDTQKQLMAELSLDVTPNPLLRRSRPLLENDEELSQEERENIKYILDNNLHKMNPLPGSGSSKQSLQDIAGSLRSTHNNTRINEYFSQISNSNSQDSNNSQHSQSHPEASNEIKMKKLFKGKGELLNNQSQTNILDDPKISQLFMNFLCSQSDYLISSDAQQNEKISSTIPITTTTTTTAGALTTTTLTDIINTKKNEASMNDGNSTSSDFEQNPETDEIIAAKQAGQQKFTADSFNTCNYENKDAPSLAIMNRLTSVKSTLLTSYHDSKRV